MDKQFNKFLLWLGIFVLLGIIGGFLVWQKQEEVSVSQREPTEKDKLKNQETKTSLTPQTLGPVESECLLLPEDIDPKQGASAYRLRNSQDALELFKYQGTVSGFEKIVITQREKECPFYKVSLTKGVKIYEVYLPENLLSISLDSDKALTGTDGQILQEQIGQLIEMTIQFKKVEEGEQGQRQFFSWQLEFL